MRSGLFVLAFAGAAIAAAQVDPPGQVARLNYLDGSVSFEPAGMEDWVPATLNRPLTTGDRLWSDSESRAELHLPSAALRLASRTALQFLNLDDRNVQVSLTEGTLSVHLWSLAEDETFEVDTPNLSFMLLRPGDYRIDADPDAQATVVTARQGQGEGTGRGDAFNLRPGEQARVSGEDTIGYNIIGAPEPDGWDRWCMDRTAREERAVSANYVGRDVIGYEDLDQYGSWGSAPDYGPIWTPRAMPAGWAPYRYGHWAWIEPWGWTWVDDAPWGFAPFHYGRWAYFGGGWAWVPGPAALGVGRHMAVRPVYSPALVAWIGGVHWGVSVSVGGGGPVGWVPLGPREVFVPAYRASSNYVTRVNTTNTVINNVNINNIHNTSNVTRVNYVNQRAPNAVTAISAADMASARPVRQVAMTVNAQQLSSAQVLMAAPVAPRREGVLGRPVPVQAVRPPVRVFERGVVARTAPPPAPVPFSQRRVVLDQNPGRPIDAMTMQQLRMSAPATSVRPQAAVVVPNRPATSPVQGQPPHPNEAGSWRTPDRPQSQPPVRNPAPAYRSDPAAAQPHVSPQAVPPVQQPYPSNDGWRRNDQRPQSPAPAQSTAPAYRSQPAAVPAPPAVRQAPVSPQVAPVSRPETAAPSVRQPPPAPPAVRQMPVNRNESGERTPHPQGGQAQKAPERKAEPTEKPRGESK